MIQLRSPIPKRCTFSPKAPFPINIFESNDEEVKQPHYYGHFNGFNVTVENRDDMIALYTMGYFGKGSLSQGYPAFDEKKQKRLQLQQKVKSENSEMKNNHEEAGTTKKTAVENLHLLLEEAFFLSFVLECFTVLHRNNTMSVNQMWQAFQSVQPYFVERYVTYHYYRARGWVVKPGLKYGGDFLLYKQGPPFYHASAVIIIISNVNENTKNIDGSALLAINRAIETARKELLIAQIYIPKDFNYRDVNQLSRCTVSEYLFKRSLPAES